jgi:hypothetical protein
MGSNLNHLHVQLGCSFSKELITLPIPKYKGCPKTFSLDLNIKFVPTLE